MVKIAFSTTFQALKWRHQVAILHLCFIQASLNFLLYHMQQTLFAYLYPKKVTKFLVLKNDLSFWRLRNFKIQVKIVFKTLSWFGSSGSISFAISTASEMSFRREYPVLKIVSIAAFPFVSLTQISTRIEARLAWSV